MGNSMIGKRTVCYFRVTFFLTLRVGAGRTRKPQSFSRDSDLTFSHETPCSALGAFQAFVEAEDANMWREGGRVYLDGSGYSAAKARARRLEDIKNAEAQLLDCEHADQCRAYLNNRPPNLFTQIVEKNYPQALQAANSLQNEHVIEQQHRILRNIKSQPKPIYFPSGKERTVRLFTSDGIPNLHGDIREALTEGWFEADLRCSQLAICAHLWEVADVQAFLANGENFWSNLLFFIGVPSTQTKSAKPIFKKAVYSICYGMKWGHVKGTTALNLYGEGLPIQWAGRFLEHPLVQSMLAARDVALGAILECGGAWTPYEKWCPVNKERQARSIMAEIAQAWELRLIYPAFALAETTRDFTIVLYQFDGLTIHFTRRADMWKRRITETVNEEIRNWGIQTTLEWKE
jgi:hypothetical protein